MPMRRRLGLGRRVYNFKRTFQASAITSTAGAAVAGGYTFALNSLPNYTEFTAMFDVYRLKAVKIEFSAPANSVGMSATSEIPQLWTAIDRNDATAPANVNELFQYDTLKHSPITRKHVRYFRVNSLGYITGQSVGTVGEINWNKWIPTSEPAINHYGLKYLVDGNGSVNQPIQVYATFYFQCKSLK